MRKYHRKTRTGCVQCKQRRIKCDETKPSCMNCTRRAVDCSLTFLTPSAPTARYQFQFKERVTAVTHNSALHTARTLSHPSKTPGLSLEPYNVELYQHYTSVAHRYLSTQARGPELWDVTVPQMALGFPFLMHGMLALSALHLASVHPNRRRELVTKAQWNEHQALPSYRSIIKNPNNDNIHAIFVFSGFVSQYSLAATQCLEAVDRRPKVRNETIADLPEFPPNWFHIIRGTSTMIYRYYLLLVKGPFGKVLQLQPEAIPFENNPEDIYLSALEPLFYPAVYTPDDRSTDPHSSSSSSPESYESIPVDKVQAKHYADLTIYAKTLSDLRRTFVLRLSPCGTINNLSTVFIFPGIVDQSYIRLLRSRKPEALILFAHYCVLLAKCEDIWYLQGVGKRLIAAIWRSLGPEWRPWISWPVAITGAIVDDGDGDGDGGTVGGEEGIGTDDRTRSGVGRVGE